MSGQDMMLLNPEVLPAEVAFLYQDKHYLVSKTAHAWVQGRPLSLASCRGTTWVDRE